MQIIFRATLRSGEEIPRRFLTGTPANRRWCNGAPAFVASKHHPPVGRSSKQISNRPDASFRLSTTATSSFSSTSRSNSKDRPDPFARRPTKKCDPYGQAGKPLTHGEASALMRTVEPEWKMLLSEDDDGENDDHEPEAATTAIPFAISKVFWHDDYMHGAKFIEHVAAVAQMNAQHFPHRVVLERQLRSKTKSWKICTKIVCRTHVLQGLSHHDFYFATLIDIEAQRPEVRGLVADD